MFFEKQIDENIAFDYVKESVDIQSYIVDSENFLKQIKHQNDPQDTQLILCELWFEADQLDQYVLNFFESFIEKHNLINSHVDVLRGVESDQFGGNVLYCLWKIVWDTQKEVLVYLRTPEHKFIPEIIVKTGTRQLSESLLSGISIREFYSILVRLMLSEFNAKSEP